MKRILLVVGISSFASSFTFLPSVKNSICIPRRGETLSIIPLQASNINSNNRSSNTSSTSGDKIRESNGIRPSLHPTIINAISEALIKRSLQDTKNPMEVLDNIEPIDVAVAAAKIAATCIENRAKCSTAVKGDESSAFTSEEAQLICGRVVGVVMRWNELESLLIERVKAQSWVIKYGEESSFGLLKEELLLKKEGEDDVLMLLKKKMNDDPLCRMCRAECLYALFLSQVERPTMEKLGQIALDGHSGIDFLDSERLDVLFPVT